MILLDCYVSNKNLSFVILNYIFYLSQGHPRLVNAIAKLYSKILKRDLDSKNEIIITVGAYEALHATIHGHTNAGDEWIIIEPFFDSYVPTVKTAGGVPRFIALKPVSFNVYVKYIFIVKKVFEHSLYLFSFISYRKKLVEQSVQEIGYSIEMKWNPFLMRRRKELYLTHLIIQLEKSSPSTNCSLLLGWQKSGTLSLFQMKYMNGWFMNPTNISG